MIENKTHTKGNIIIEDIDIGDIHYEFEYNVGIKSQVISKPTINKEGNWVWQSRNLTTGGIINYLVNPKYPHYSVNLYDYEAYQVKYYI